MKFLATLVILAASALSSFAQAPGPVMNQVTVAYDYTYDNPNFPLSETACSDGVNGLASKWPTLADVPGQPFVGGIPGLTWNSTLCGSCWQMEYFPPDGSTHIMNIIAIDAAETFNIAYDAFSAWAGSDGVAAGSVTAWAGQLSPSDCGIFN